MLPTNRRPTPPGEILLEEFLAPAATTQIVFAKRLGISLQRLNGIINGKRAVTAETALLLSRELNTSAEFWLGLQMNVDLWDARERLEKLEKRQAAGGKVRAKRAQATAARIGGKQR